MGCIEASAESQTAVTSEFYHLDGQGPGMSCPQIDERGMNLEISLNLATIWRGIKTTESKRRCRKSERGMRVIKHRCMQDPLSLVVGVWVLESTHAQDIESLFEDRLDYIQSGSFLGSDQEAQCQ
jgi:hypothetical protein